MMTICSSWPLMGFQHYKYQYTKWPLIYTQFTCSKKYFSTNDAENVYKEIQPENVHVSSDSCMQCPAPVAASMAGFLSTTGVHLGNIITFPLSGVLCQYGFDGGWPSVFYVFGRCVRISSWYNENGCLQI